jgi:hypothetical protein
MQSNGIYSSHYNIWNLYVTKASRHNLFQNNSTMQFNYTLMNIQKTNLRKLQDTELTKNNDCVRPIGNTSQAGCGQQATNWIGLLHTVSWKVSATAHAKTAKLFYKYWKTSEKWFAYNNKQETKKQNIFQCDAISLHEL